jgi:hypothetical protein
LNATLKVIAVLMLLAVFSRDASAQTGLGRIGPTKAEVVGAAIGLGAIVTGILYLTLHKAYITGCTQSADGASSLTDDQDGHTYALVDESSEVKAGKRVKLQGKKKKDKQGKRSFRVMKIKKDYGPCQQ